MNLASSKTIGNLLWEFMEMDLSHDGVIGIPYYLLFKVNVSVESSFPNGFQNIMRWINSLDRIEVQTSFGYML